MLLFAKHRKEITMPLQMMRRLPAGFGADALAIFKRG